MMHKLAGMTKNRGCILSLGQDMKRMYSRIYGFTVNGVLNKQNISLWAVDHPRQFCRKDRAKKLLRELPYRP
jgi:hypothetical protein